MPTKVLQFLLEKIGAKASLIKDSEFLYNSDLMHMAHEDIQGYVELAKELIKEGIMP